MVFEFFSSRFVLKGIAAFVRCLIREIPDTKDADFFTGMSTGTRLDKEE